MKKYTGLLLLVFSTQCLLAQKPFSVKIQFSQNINLKNIKVGYDNGKNRDVVEYDAFVNNRFVISGTQYSKYVTLWFLDETKDNFLDWRYFWVNGQNASISFTSNDSSKNIFDQHVLKNAYSLLDVGKKHDTYCYAENNAYKLFFDAYVTEKFTGEFTDSLQNVQKRLLDASNNKDIEFIKANNTSYFSFDYFRRNLATQSIINPDTLYSVFKMFPTEFRESYEGKPLALFLAGKCLKKGSQPPTFDNKDYFTKQPVTNKIYTNKYVLLVYWASWCKPCIAEMPVIRKIRAIYPTDKLEIIGITLDTDSSKFVKAVEKYNMNWTHVFGDIHFIKSFGVQVIPEVFLIDNKGKIAYKREEEKDYQLEYLQKLLEERINN